MDGERDSSADEKLIGRDRLLSSHSVRSDPSYPLLHRVGDLSSKGKSREPREGIRIFLVRHGESMGNVDHEVYKRWADHTIPLSCEGERQAQAAGESLLAFYQSLSKADAKTRYAGRHVRLLKSPYKRARETSANIIKVAGEYIHDVKESIYLGEQQFGLFEGLSVDEVEKMFPRENALFSKSIRYGGRYWARPPLGESRFDVSLRVARLIDEICKDSDELNINDFIIVSHGVTIRAFLMMWLDRTPEWFENARNPKNCEVYHVLGGSEQSPLFPGFSRRADDDAPVADSDSDEEGVGEEEDGELEKNTMLSGPKTREDVNHPRAPPRSAAASERVGAAGSSVPTSTDHAVHASADKFEKLQSQVAALQREMQALKMRDAAPLGVATCSPFSLSARSLTQTQGHQRPTPPPSTSLAETWLERATPRERSGSLTQSSPAGAGRPARTGAPNRNRHSLSLAVPDVITSYGPPCVEFKPFRDTSVARWKAIAVEEVTLSEGHQYNVSVTGHAVVCLQPSVELEDTKGGVYVAPSLFRAVLHVGPKELDLSTVSDEGRYGEAFTNQRDWSTITCSTSCTLAEGTHYVRLLGRIEEAPRLRPETFCYSATVYRPILISTVVPRVDELRPIHVQKPSLHSTLKEYMCDSW